MKQGMVFPWKFALPAVFGALGLGECVSAQTRFPGDSPRRNATRPIGTPPPLNTSGKVATFTFARGIQTFGGTGFGGVGYSPYVFSPYVYRRQYVGYSNFGYGGVGYGGWGYGGWGYGRCATCGCVGSLCQCRGPAYLPPVVLDHRGVYQGPFVAPAFGGQPPAAAAVPVQAAAPVRAAAFVPPRRGAAQGANAGAAPAGLLPRGQAAAKAPAPDPGRTRAWRYIDHGDRHLKAGKTREALSRYRKAERSDPNLGAARWRQALAYLGLGNIERATRALGEGLDRDPTWPSSDFVLNDVMNDEAIVNLMATLDERLQTFPNDADARRLAGVLHHFNGAPDEAMKEFRRVLQITGEDRTARRFLPQQPEAEDAAALAP